jgi:dihydroneopterin aldolase / 2-amino-4-hydroxy-6-hydroxymethyldihydropteridine diphosphokinase
VDRISIRGLRVATRVGVTPAERAKPQAVTINVEMCRDLRKPGQSDDLDDTIDYHAVTVAIAAMVRATEAKLLEHLAEKIASLVRGLPSVDRVTVEVRKEPPPIEEDVQAVGVTIERQSG